MHKREFRGLICAMMLGDGCIYHGKGTRQPKGRAFYCMNHSSEQQDYAIWKAELLNDIFREKNLPRRCTFSKSKKKNKITGKEYNGIYVKLSWSEYFRLLHKKCYKILKGEKRKNIDYLLNNIYSDLHLAIWFMDDGTEKRHKNTSGTRNVRKYINPFYELCTYSYTEGQCNIAIQWLKREYGVVPRLCYDKCRGENGWKLRFTCPDSERLFHRLQPYFNQVESMRNKFWLSFERYLPDKEDPLKGDDIVRTN